MNGAFDFEFNKGSFLIEMFPRKGNWLYFIWLESNSKITVYREEIINTMYYSIHS